MEWCGTVVYYPSRKSLYESKLIKDIIEERPEGYGLFKRYFGKNCLKEPGFKIQTLEMACILFGVDQKMFLKELEGLRN
jgi:hypothetical protein